MPVEPVTETAMPTYFDLEVSLLEIEPRIWRCFQLAAVSSFETLHDAIQDAFGWQRRHLYEFRHIDDGRNIRTKSVQPVRRIARCRQADILDKEIIPFADDLKVASFFAEKEDRCLYLYDFGDGWQHLVQLKDAVESRERFTQRLLGGAMACPPEDCGGPIGYEQMLDYVAMNEEQVAKLDEAERPEVEWLRGKYRGWMPDAFDIASAKASFET